MPKKKFKAQNNLTTTEKELTQIKKLLMLLLIKTGTSQSELAFALQLDQADVSRMLPVRKITKFDKF
jgi:DNA-binding MarR family transcriptional regulator